jgi:hypothetical protein
MEKNTAVGARSGISEELLKEIAAQNAILSSARSLVSQLLDQQKQEVGFGPWVYNLEGLQNWVHHYTERRKLNCKTCHRDRIFVCQTCGDEVEYHDEL